MVILESGDNGTIHRTNQKLAKRIQELNEENNLLRLKYETVLNMVCNIISAHLLNYYIIYFLVDTNNCRKPSSRKRIGTTQKRNKTQGINYFFLFFVFYT